MSVNPDTLRALAAMRKGRDGVVDGLTRSTISAWASAWDEVKAAWREAIEDVIARASAGDPIAAALLRSARAGQAMNVTADILAELTAQVERETLAGTPQAVSTVVDGQAEMIATQFPPQAGDKAVLAAQFNQAAAVQVQAIVSRTASLIDAPLAGIPAQVMSLINRELVRGIALGTNPRTVAARMLRRTERQFNGGAGRALTIARTEMLDATRNAAMTTNLANASVLQGWQWVSALDRRTCPSCWAQHGSIHPLDESGPDDHPNGRCTGVPVTRSWADLGYRNVTEPPSVLPDAREQFASLSAAEQLDIMGPSRLSLLNSGAISWEDLSQERRAGQWRRQFEVTPVVDLARRAAA